MRGELGMCYRCHANDPILMQPYSGEKLCKRCFCKSMEDRVRTTIAKYGMLDLMDRTAVAVSGGKDSLSLLHLLVKIEKAFLDASLCAVTVDEGVRGYRDEALKIARKNCQRLGIEHIVTSFKEMYGYELDELVEITKPTGLEPCSYCGALRRKALNTAAREIGADKLATAHNLDDETQTMILNILHGDPSRIARVKPVLDVTHPKFVQRIKPLCEVPEREIALYAYLKGIEFQSNPCPYAGTALRSDVRTMLNRVEEKHPGTKFTIFRSVERLRPALETVVREIEIKECKVCGEPAVGEVCKPCQMLQELSVL